MTGGVSPGLACSISATVPATAGAAMDVPLNCISRVVFDAVKPPISRVGYRAISVFAGDPLFDSAPNT